MPRSCLLLYSYKHPTVIGTPQWCINAQLPWCSLPYSVITELKGSPMISTEFRIMFRYATFSSTHTRSHTHTQARGGSREANRAQDKAECCIGIRDHSPIISIQSHGSALTRLVYIHKSNIVSSQVGESLRLLARASPEAGPKVSIAFYRKPYSPPDDSELSPHTYLYSSCAIYYSVKPPLHCIANISCWRIYSTL